MGRLRRPSSRWSRLELEHDDDIAGVGRCIVGVGAYVVVK